MALTANDAFLMTTWPLPVLDLLGVFVFGLSGGLEGVRKPLDILGVFVLTIELNAFAFHPRVARIERLVLLPDAEGLGLFVCSRRVKTLQLDAAPLTVVILGSGPASARRCCPRPAQWGGARGARARELYAIPALVGAAGWPEPWTAGYTGP